MQGMKVSDMRYMVRYEIGYSSRSILVDIDIFFKNFERLCLTLHFSKSSLLTRTLPVRCLSASLLNRYPMIGLAELLLGSIVELMNFPDSKKGRKRVINPLNGRLSVVTSPKKLNLGEEIELDSGRACLRLISVDAEEQIFEPDFFLLVSNDLIKDDIKSVKAERDGLANGRKEMNERRERVNAGVGSKDDIKSVKAQRDGQANGIKYAVKKMSDLHKAAKKGDKSAHESVEKQQSGNRAKTAKLETNVSKIVDDLIQQKRIKMDRGTIMYKATKTSIFKPAETPATAPKSLYPGSKTRFRELVEEEWIVDHPRESPDDIWSLHCIIVSTKAKSKLKLIGVDYDIAVDLMKDPIDFFLVAPSSRPSISPVPTTETQPPTRGPTPKPTNSPTARIQYDPTLCLGCPTGSNLLLPSTDCLGFYYCTNGYSSSVISCPAGTLFDVGIQTCNWADAVTCQCASQPAPTTPAPVTSPVAADLDACGSCPVSNWDMVGARDCSGFYHCISGSPSNFISCPDGTIWSPSIKGCDWPWRTECACSA
eukprot:scaffold4565_cov53-Cyclotella_meneghiniana.AAC.7